MATTASAQSSLSGIVHDPTSRIAVGATITVYDTTGTHQWGTHSSTLGYFEIDLPPGEYRIQADLDQMTFTGIVHVLPNEKTAVDVTLKIRPVEVEVNVPGTRPRSAWFDAQAPLGATFTREQIENLPLINGDSLQPYQSMVPGLVATDSVGTLAQYTAVGQRRFSNRTTIDGASADLEVGTVTFDLTNEAGSGKLPAISTLGGTQTILPRAAIEEMQVQTTNASSQNARTPGAQTIVVTHAGGDRFSGDAFTEWRPETLGAADWFADSHSNPNTAQSIVTTRRQPASSLIGGASLGGPIIRQKVFSFAAWEYQRVNRPARASFPVPSLTLRDSASDIGKPLLDALPEPNGIEGSDGLGMLSHDFPAVSSLSTFSLRIDASLSPNHHLFGRINVGGSTGDLLETSQVPTTLSTRTETTDARTATVGLTSSFSRLTNDLRVNTSLNRGSLIASQTALSTRGPLPLDLLLPEGVSAATSFVNVFAPFFGGSITQGPAAANTQKQIQVNDTLSLTHGRHEWRVGVDARWATSFFDPARETYNYRFLTTSDFVQGEPRTLTVVTQSPFTLGYTNFAAFAEDAFRVSAHFSVRYGLRYSVAPPPSSRSDAGPLLLDIGALPEPRALPPGTPLWKTSWGTLGPQIGAIYQFGAGTGHETNIRASWNLVFDTLANAGSTSFGISYPYSKTRFLISPVLPVSHVALATPAPPLFSPADRSVYSAYPTDFRSPRTYSWQFGIDQALGSTQRLSIAYAGAAGRELSYWYNYPPDLPSHLWTVNAFSNDGASDYHALLTEYVWRLSHGLDAHLSYTWSHAIDLDSGEMVSPNAPPSLVSPLLNRASADFDRRHVLQALVSYQLPIKEGRGFLGTLGSDWQIDARIAARSGAPVNVTAARDIGFGNYLSARPDPVAGVPIWIVDPTSPTGERINAAAFEVPTDLRQGTLGRNTLRSAPLREIDFGLSRSIHIGERVVARLRVDAFNVFNIPSFGSPVAELASLPSSFGRPTETYANALGTGTLSRGGLVPIQQFGGPRSVQVGLRLSF